MAYSRIEKQTAIVDGVALEYAIAGSGSPAIVLLNGAGGPLEAWSSIWEELSGSHQILAYNRAGMDGSRKPDRPQTSDVVVATLRGLLRKIGVGPPYVLVGHSLGGLHAHLFARQHPSEICGIVFLDATAPGDVALMNANKDFVARGLERLIDALLGKDEYGETTHARASADLIERADAFPDVPVIVVTGGKPAMKWLTPKLALEGRARNQILLSAMSPSGRQIIAGKSGHFPQFSEPRLVIEAIQAVMKLCRGSKTSV